MENPVLSEQLISHAITLCLQLVFWNSSVGDFLLRWDALSNPLSRSTLKGPSAGLSE